MVAEEVPIRPASTVVLVRDSAARPEIFMVKRHAKSAFGSRFAFPGGVLEAADANVHDLGAGLSAARADELLQLQQGALDFYSAAIRELFEESGVLLASHQLDTQELQRGRSALQAGSISWERFARDNQLQLHYDELHYFSFWITPAGLPKRYAARFFLAELPATQFAHHDGVALTDSCWMPAADMLAARKQKRLKLPYPTRKTLKRVARFSTVRELLQWAMACGAKGVRADRPAFRPEELL